MKASVRWLREICPRLPDDPAAIAERLTAGGIEVEGSRAFGAGTRQCIVSEVLSSAPHPSRGGLRVVMVASEAGSASSGRGAPRQVVCGAPNVPAPGGLVVPAPPGVHLPAKGVTLERRAIAGVDSAGMLCSEAELGLGDDADGILVLPPGTASVGMTLAQAFPEADDTILELGLTPNRADGLGHIGLAREAAALVGVAFRAAEPPAAARSGQVAPSGHVPVSIEDPERCPHYGTAVLGSAAVAPSPLGVRWRLGALGVRAISNVVDVTNLVMLEFGHPLHAFDLDLLRDGRVVVRRAREGERLATLDGEDRALSPDDLVICDAGGPLALAGVMGGRFSEITAKTTRVLVECAYFDPRGVRRTARRHGMHTESSHRFERGVDWGDTAAALARAAALVVRLSGASDRVGTACPRGAPSRAAGGGPEAGAGRGFARRRGGPRCEASAILERLGFVRPAARGEALAADAWEVPSHRSDVSREVDLIEEVARVRGYDAIPTELPAVHPSRDRAPQERRARLARQAAVAIGLSEAVTFSFVAPRDLAAVRAPPAAVLLANPLVEEQSAMRTSLLPGLLAVLSRARRHGERDARMFSVDRLFLASGEGKSVERLAFAAVLHGSRPVWLEKPQPLDVWDGKGLVEGFVHRLLRRAASIVAAPPGEAPSHLHPRGAAWIEVDGARVGTMGPLHPDVADAYDLGEAPILVEVDLEALDAVGTRPVAFVAPPRFPASLRDIAVVVREDVAAGDLTRAVREAAGDLAEEVTLFDRFAGGAIPTGHTSLAMRVVYRASDRTLTDAEVDTRHARVVAQEIGRQSSVRRPAALVEALTIDRRDGLRVFGNHGRYRALATMAPGAEAG